MSAEPSPPKLPVRSTSPETSHAEQKTDKRNVLYRSRFEELWGNLPGLVVLAALPGWGKQTWMKQCGEYLRQSSPATQQVWVDGSKEIFTLIDEVRENDRDLVCFVNGRSSGYQIQFWTDLGRGLSERSWLRVVVASYGLPAELPEVVKSANILQEQELAFNSRELAQSREALAATRNLNDVFFSDQRELGCPYLVGLQLDRLSSKHEEHWVASDLRSELSLLKMLTEALDNTELCRYSIGRVLIVARRFRAFSADLVASKEDPIPVVARDMNRLGCVPLFDRSSDDEFHADQLVWREAVWKKLLEQNGSAQVNLDLTKGLEAVLDSGRIVAALYYLLSLGREEEAEALVRRNFRWFLMFCDPVTASAVVQTSPSPEIMPALTLLQGEHQARKKSPTAASRKVAAQSLSVLRNSRTTDTWEEIEISGLSAFAAAVAGRREDTGELTKGLLALLQSDEAQREWIPDDPCRLRFVGSCYLAYWACLQTDDHLRALAFAQTMVEMSDPKDRAFPYELVGLTTEEDLHGLRSLSPEGKPPSESEQTHAQPLIDLEEGEDQQALSFIRPIVANASPLSRSALDAMVLLVRAIASPTELTVDEIESSLEKSRQIWEDDRASSFVVWSALIAFAAVGARKQAGVWAASLQNCNDVFAQLSRLSLAYWDGDEESAYNQVENMGSETPPRLRVCAGILVAALHSKTGQGERAARTLKRYWRETPAPRLFRFALRLVSEESFQGFLEVLEFLPDSLSVVIGESEADRRLATWTETPKLTESERAILKLIILGKSNRQIAEARFVTVGTVRSQLKTLYRKLGVEDRFEALELAEDLHLL